MDGEMWDPLRLAVTVKAFHPPAWEWEMHSLGAKLQSSRISLRKDSKQWWHFSFRNEMLAMPQHHGICRCFWTYKWPGGCLVISWGGRVEFLKMRALHSDCSTEPAPQCVIVGNSVPVLCPHAGDYSLGVWKDKTTSHTQRTRHTVIPPCTLMWYFHFRFIFKHCNNSSKIIFPRLLMHRPSF